MIGQPHLNIPCCILLQHSAPSLTPSHTRHFVGHVFLLKSDGVPQKVTGHCVELSLRNSQSEGYSVFPLPPVESSFPSCRSLPSLTQNLDFSLLKPAFPLQAAIKATFSTQLISSHKGGPTTGAPYLLYICRCTLQTILNQPMDKPRALPSSLMGF